jgi:hypothetical protein
MITMDDCLNHFTKKMVQFYETQIYTSVSNEKLNPNDIKK